MTDPALEHDDLSAAVAGRRSGRLRWRVVLGTVALVVACAAAPVAVPAAWQARADQLRNERVAAATHYPSVEFMARYFGCTTTLRPVPNQGGSIDAGTCTLPNPTSTTPLRITMRIFGVAHVGDASQQAVDWLNTAPVGPPGGAGGNWAFTVTGTKDPAVLNPIFTALPDGTEADD
jgi:hypothetical protein